MKNNFVLVSFFRVTEPYSGGSEVSFNFFKNIPSKNKQLFQYSDKNKNHKNVQSVLIKNTIIQKLIYLNELAKKIKNYCRNKKNLTIIIEGASWAGLTYFLYRILKKDLSNAKFVYHSHNIEYLLRKQKNNFLISLLTKYFENYIGKNFDIFTSVSNADKKKLKQIYNIDTKIIPNGVEFPNISKIKEKKFKFKYIFFCGSINYMPNKEALEILVNKIMPLVNKVNPNIKLVVSGNKTIPIKDKNLINVGFVTKKEFYRFLKGASIFVNPMKIAFGSQVKMISALVFGKIIIASKKAIIGLDIYKCNNLFVTDNNQEFANLILKKINGKRFNNNSSKSYQKKYSMKNIILKFFKNYLT